MRALREAKEKLVQEITEKIQGAKSTFLVEYHGLTVDQITQIRNDLRAEGGEMKVYKNRFVKIAAKKAGIDGLDDALLGPNAFVFSNEDEIAGARILAEHGKKYETIKFKAGIFEGKAIGAEMATELSQIPSRETLLTQIAAGLLQPLKQVAIGLNMLEESHFAGAEKVQTKEESTPVEETKVNNATVEEVKSEEESAPAEEKKEESAPAEEAKEETAT